jgi:WD40 repeat protein
VSPGKPEFHLTRVYDEGGDSAKPEVVPLARLPWDVQTGRRGFLGTGVAAGIVLAVSRCGGGGDSVAEPAPADPVAQVSPPDACSGTRTSSANALAFTPEGSLVSGGSDGTVKVWKPGQDFEPQTLGGPVRGKDIPALTALALGSGGSLVAAGDADGNLKLWDLADRRLITTIDRLGSEITAVASSPDDQILAWASAAGVRMSGPETASTPLEGVDGGIGALAFAPDSALLASGGEDGTVRLSAMPDGALAESLAGHTGPVTALAITPDGSRLASGSEDGTVKLWTLPEAEEEATLEVPSGAAVNALAIDSNGELLVSGDSRGTAQIWTLADGTLTTTMDANDGPVRALAIRGNREVVCGGTEQITAWRLPEGTFQSCRIVPKAEPKEPPEPEPAPVPEPTQGLPTTPPEGTPGVQPPVTPTTPGTPGVGGSICTCDQVCTCIPVSDRRLKTAIRPLVTTAAG